MDARALHFDALVVDGHADTVSRALDDGQNLTERVPAAHIDVPSMFEGGLDAQFFAAFVHPKFLEGNRAVQRALDMIDALKRLCDASGGRLQVARTASDVERLNAAGRKSCILCIEGGHAIADDLGVLRAFHELGVRYLTLTWNNSNSWADGCGEEPRHGGLTPFGREVVKEMNRIGMIVDVSHVHEKTFWAALETTSRPVMASHSCARALCDHRRNLRDEQLRAVAGNGGVVGVNFYPAFVSEAYRRAVAPIHAREAEALKNARGDAEIDAIRRRADEEERTLPRPSIDDVVAHVERIVEVAGIDHVGLGADFDGVPTLPAGLEGCARLPALTARLAERGFDEEGIRKFLGGNMLRVMRAAIDDVA
jgi:membrane dipeptidase